MLKIYAVRDNCADAMLKPFFLPNDAVAYRAVRDAVKDGHFGVHLRDYSLYCLGDYYESTGGIIPLPNKIHMIDFVDLEAAE